MKTGTSIRNGTFRIEKDDPGSSGFPFLLHFESEIDGGKPALKFKTYREAVAYCNASMFSPNPDNWVE